MFRIFVVFYAILLCSGCRNSVPIEELDLAFEQKIWLTGGIKEGHLSYFLAKTLSVIDTLSSSAIREHDRKIYKNGTLFPLEFQMKDHGVFVHFYVEDSAITVGDEFLLEVSVPDFETLYTQNIIPPQVTFEIADVNFYYKTISDKYFNTSIKINDNPKTKNFYRLMLEHPYIGYQTSFYFPDMENPERDYYFTDDLLEDGILNFELIQGHGETTFGTADNRFKMILCQIDSTYYYSTLTSQFQSKMLVDGSYYSFEPINVYSNVSNGLGSFVAISSPYEELIDLEKFEGDQK